MHLTAPRLLLCFSLLLGCGQAAATESRQMDANGDSACADGSQTDTPRIDDTDDAGTAPARRAPQKSKSPATATPRTSGGGPRSPPRWHSFLPGMIR